MKKEELAKQYRIQQYIDFGDLNEKAEQQIEQAFIDGYKKALSLFSVSGACDCEIIDARNEVIESGYMCIKCRRLFKAHYR